MRSPGDHRKPNDCRQNGKFRSFEASTLKRSLFQSEGDEHDGERLQALYSAEQNLVERRECAR